MEQFGLNILLATISSFAFGSGNGMEHFYRFPLAFESNHGQADARFLFLTRGRGYDLLLGEREAVLVFGSEDRSVLRLELEGASACPSVELGEKLPGKVNYYRGQDPAQWLSEIPTYAKVKLNEIYPGIDLIYYGTEGELEFDFFVRPGGDPSAIVLTIGGAEMITSDAEGQLQMLTAAGVVSLRPPKFYQDNGGIRTSIAGGFVLLPPPAESGSIGEFRVGFKASAYNSKLALVIDPVLSYSTYLGGSGIEYFLAVSVDASGQAYVTGTTNSTDYPPMNPIQANNAGGDCGGNGDVVISKIAADGLTLLFSTYLGGSGCDIGADITVDKVGNVYVAGETNSPNFPTRNAIQEELRNLRDAFVLKLDTGGQLIYSTYLGSDGDDGASRIVADGSGRAYVTGYNKADNFPTASALQPHLGGMIDAFITKFSPTGDLVYSTFLGGSNWEFGNGIAVDSQGNAYVIGQTLSTDFPTSNPLQTNNGSSSNTNDIFIVKLSADGSSLDFSTYLGQSENEVGVGIGLDTDNKIWILAQTDSPNLPVVNGFQTRYGGGPLDLFLAKLSPDGLNILYSTYLGGSGTDTRSSLSIDAAGSALVLGHTDSKDFPILKAMQERNAGGLSDLFITKVSAGGVLLYSTYMGGSKRDYAGKGFAIDTTGAVYLTGFTNSPDFPLSNPIQSSELGVYDGFIAKLINPIRGLSCKLVSTSVQLSWTNSEEYKRVEILRDDDTLAILPGSTVNYFDRSPGIGIHRYEVLGFSGNPNPPAQSCSLNVVSPQNLPLDQAVETTLTDAVPAAWFKFRYPAGAAVEITLTGDDQEDANTLFLFWGEVSKIPLYDQAANLASSASQTLLIPSARNQEGLLLVQGNTFHDGSNHITLLAHEQSILLSAVSTLKLDKASSPARLNVSGAHFSPESVFSLTDPGNGVLAAAAQKPALQSPQRAELGFDLSQVAAGIYRLTASAAGKTAELADLIEVVEPRTGPILRARLELADRIRYNRSTRLTLIYENAGDAPMAAPLFQIAGPPESELRLEEEADFHGNTLQVLGIDPEGIAGLLPPGKTVSIPVTIRARSDGEALIALRIFSPNRNQFIPWQEDQLAPPGISADAWRQIWPLLSVRLGASWIDYQKSVADIATRLARRHVLAASVRELFRFAVRQALDRPHMAAVGRVYDSATGTPIYNARVAADEDKALKACAVSDLQGAFTLDGLEAGKQYQIRFEGYRKLGGNLEISITGDQDLLGLEIPLERDPASLLTECPPADSTGLPEEPIPLPLDSFSTITSRSPAVLRSFDPNQKDGPKGQGEEDLFPIQEPLLYTIHFENDPRLANAPAQSILVKDQLDKNLAWNTIRTLGVQAGDYPFTLHLEGGASPASIRSGYPASATRQGSGALSELLVYSGFSLDEQSGVAAWEFQVLNSQHKVATLEADQGILPVGAGGSVSFSILAKPETPDDTEIINHAEITFDHMDNPKGFPTNYTVNKVRNFQPTMPENHWYLRGPEDAVEIDATLNWESSPLNALYDLKLWTGAEEPQNIVEEAQNLTASAFKPKIPLTVATEYHWRVVVKNQFGSAPGESWTFRTVDRLLPPEKPESINPRDQAVSILVRGQTFEWKSAARADSYTLFIWEHDQQPGDPVAHLSATSFQLQDRNLKDYTEYNWQVLAANSSGSAEGSIWAFRTKSTKQLFKRNARE